MKKYGSVADVCSTRDRYGKHKLNQALTGLCLKHSLFGQLALKLDPHYGVCRARWDRCRPVVRYAHLAGTDVCAGHAMLGHLDTWTLGHLDTWTDSTGIQRLV